MMLGARTAAWANGVGATPAIWISGETTYFNSEVPFGDGHVIVDVKFYRKFAPREGQYIFGGAFNSQRFDACVYTSEFWYVGYGSNSSTIYFSSGGAMLYNAVNRIVYDVDYVSKLVSFSANGHSLLASKSFNFKKINFSPYIGARNINNSISEPTHDAGIISIDIDKDGSPFRRYRPRVIGGAVGLFDEVNNLFHAPLNGGDNITYIADITNEGVVL